MTAGCWRPIRLLADGTLFAAVQAGGVWTAMPSPSGMERRTCFALTLRFPPKSWLTCPPWFASAVLTRAFRRTYLWIWSLLLGRTHETLLRATRFWIRVLANDVYGFHSWQPECLRSFQIGLSRVWPRTSDAPAKLLRTFSHLSRSRSLHRCAFPAWKPFSWQCVLRALFGLRLPRRSEHSPSVCLHVVPAQQSQQ